MKAVNQISDLDEFDALIDKHRAVWVESTSILHIKFRCGHIDSFLSSDRDSALSNSKRMVGTLCKFCKSSVSVTESNK